MKALVYGRQSLANRVRANLAEHGIEAVIVAGTTNPPASLSACPKPDIVFIDRAEVQALTASRYIHDSWRVCTILITGNDNEDWYGLEQFPVDGYIPERFSNEELKARLHAILRRRQMAAQENAR